MALQTRAGYVIMDRQEVTGRRILEIRSYFVAVSRKAACSGVFFSEVRKERKERSAMDEERVPQEGAEQDGMMVYIDPT